GPLPTELAQMAGLKTLDLSTNLLQGRIPSEIMQLTELNSLNLRHNAVFPADNALFQFLNEAHSDSQGAWLRTQTMPPSLVQVAQVNAGIVDLTWNAPTSMAGQTSAGDAFQVFARSGSSGEELVFTGIEVSSSQRSARIQGLELDADHFIAMRTVTRRSDPDDELLSVFSDEVLHQTPAVFEFYFPFFQSDAERFTGFAVSNFSELPTGVEFSAFGSDGGLLTLPRNPSGFHLEPGSQLSLLGREIFEAIPQEPAWVLLTTDNPSLAPVFLAGSFALSEMEGDVAFIESFERLHFSRVYQGPDAYRGQAADTFLSLINPRGDEAVSVRLRLLAPPPAQAFEDPDVLLAPERTIELGPRQMLFGTVAEIFEIEETIRTADIVAEAGARGLVGFQMHRFPRSAAGMSARPPIAEKIVASPQLASGAAGPGATVFSDLKLVNRHVFWSAAHLTALRDSGGEWVRSDPIGMWPGRSLELDVGSFLKLHPGGSPLAVGSMELEFVNLISQADVIYGEAESLRFATAFPLQEKAFRKAVFGYVANFPEIFTGLAFLNPGAETAEISLTVRDRNGFVTGQGQLSLAGGARRSQLLSELLESLLIQTGGYLLVESTHPIMAQEMFGDSALNFVSVVPPTVIE
ncbi:MAG TPA: hypothetical protein VMN76_01530, partial [Acidobacteriota bacterium]|nr:hypothetical protein [Acidobacteriota bacterium]